MDSTTGQNNNQGGEKKPFDVPAGQAGSNQNKPQLSWSQPVSTSTQVQKNNSAASPAVAKPVYKTTTFRNAAISLLLIVAVGTTAAIIISNKDKNTDDGVRAVPSNSATTTFNGSSAVLSAQTPNGDLVIASPQDAGLHVIVSKVTVPVPTWVVVYENHNGQPGNVLGAGLFMTGTTGGTVDLLRGTLSGQTYFVGKARDDGDRKYSLQNDPALRDADGDPVWVQFQTK